MRLIMRQDGDTVTIGYPNVKGARVLHVPISGLIQVARLMKMRNPVSTSGPREKVHLDPHLPVPIRVKGSCSQN